jgi:hypothetical protein
VRPSLKIAIGAALLSAALAAIASYSVLRPAALPQPYRAVHKEVFPELDFGAATVGSSVDRVYGSFGKAVPDPSTQTAPRRCVYFHYDADLYEGALVVLANAAVVQQRWLVKGAAKPTECAGLPEEAVDLRGWYAAALHP